jgi:hypothetical protein
VEALITREIVRENMEYDHEVDDQPAVPGHQASGRAPQLFVSVEERQR